MEVANFLELSREGRAQARREEGNAVAAAFAVTHDDVSGGKVEVFDAETRALEDAEARAVHQRRHEAWDAAYPAEDDPHLVACQDDREALGAARARKVVDPGRSEAQDVPVQEYERAQGLLVGRGTDLAGDKVVQGGFASARPSSFG